MHCEGCGGRYYENGDDGDVPGTGHNDGDDDDNDQKHAAHPDLHRARVQTSLRITVSLRTVSSCDP